MTSVAARFLVLACGNTLRGDDGVGPWLAAWAENRFQAEPAVRIISQQQWTPELAEDIARAEEVLFIDCSLDSAPGVTQLVSVEPAAQTDVLATHHLGPSELLALASGLYNSLPRTAMLLTIGASSMEFGEHFSAEVQVALPLAYTRIEERILCFLDANPFTG